MKKIFFASFAGLLFSSFVSAQNTTSINLAWLEANKGTQPTGVTWGVPFAKGSVKKAQSFTLTAADGSVLPVQSWPLAYWPDGSVKWSGFATVANGQQSTFKLTPGSGKASTPSQTLQVNETGTAIRI